VGLALLTFVLTAAGESRGQDLEILDRGKPVAGVSVSAGGQVVGTTDSTGQISFNPNLLNVTKGETVEVWIKDCGDGKVQIVLAREGSDDPCVEEGAEAGERCGCRKIGAFVAGGGPVTIDVGRRTVTQTGMGSGAATSSFVIGVGLDILQLLELQNVLEEVDTGATDHDATGWAPGFQLFGEWRYRRILAVGIEGGYSRMETEILFPQGRQTGEIDYYRLGLNAKVGRSTTGRFWPYGAIGWYRGWNKGDFEIDGLSDHRVHKTSLVGIGAGFDYWASPKVGLRFEGLYSSTFDDPDADEHIRWKFGLLYGVGRTLSYAQERGGLYE
jgi:uncharacterized cupredoxin-like copper-binding protein